VKRFVLLNPETLKKIQTLEPKKEIIFECFDLITNKNVYIFDNKHGLLEFVFLIIDSISEPICLTIQDNNKFNLKINDETIKCFKNANLSDKNDTCEIKKLYPEFFI